MIQFLYADDLVNLYQDQLSIRLLVKMDQSLYAIIKIEFSN